MILPGTSQLTGGAKATGALDAGNEKAVDVILVGAGEGAKVSLQIDGLARNRDREEAPDGSFAEADEAWGRRSLLVVCQPSAQPGPGRLEYPALGWHRRTC